MAGEIEPFKRRCLKTIRVTRSTVVPLENLRSQNIPAALQMLVEMPMPMPKSLWIDSMDSWSVGKRVKREWVDRMRVKRWRRMRLKTVAIAGDNGDVVV